MLASKSIPLAKKILFTGASSFTGFRFVESLVEDGHDVTAVLTRSPETYAEPLRKRRIQALMRLAERSNAGKLRLVFGLRFGEPGFVQLILGDHHWDLLAHHGADVTNYRSAEFQPARALANNTQGLPEVLSALLQRQCNLVLLTGSIFEGGEGSGTSPLIDVSPYGLSKRLTFEVFSFYCRTLGVTLSKFVIPNPFGAYEETRFTAYLVNHWLSGQTPTCSTPAYIRDNIHGSLLARSYAHFCAHVSSNSTTLHLAPSGYVESQGDFARRVARELEPRLGVPCPIEFQNQLGFDEPKVRINLDPLDPNLLGWNEEKAWDEMAHYYLSMRREP